MVRVSKARLRELDQLVTKSTSVVNSGSISSPTGVLLRADELQSRRQRGLAEITSKIDGFDSSAIDPRLLPEVVINTETDIQYIVDTGEDLIEFELFPDLPIEIRKIIWEMAGPEQFILQVTATIKLWSCKETGERVKYLAFHCDPRPYTRLLTTLLASCTESRDVTIHRRLPHRLRATDKNQELRFGNIDTLCILNGGEFSRIIDQLTLDNKASVQIGPWIEGVHDLMLPSAILPFWDNNRLLCKLLLRFRQLKVLSFLLQSDYMARKYVEAKAIKRENSTVVLAKRAPGGSNMEYNVTAVENSWGRRGDRDQLEKDLNKAVVKMSKSCLGIERYIIDLNGKGKGDVDKKGTESDPGTGADADLGAEEEGEDTVKGEKVETVMRSEHWKLPEVRLFGLKQNWFSDISSYADEIRNFEDF
ncbi:hypothetical protein BDZ45DRAFT_699451 [Acephala macrosclerotiorum]|nr:hypothetical protein BDZ45DRAFT_699451 [Acephala macrosclerotiorum]